MDQKNVARIHRWSFYAGSITWKVYDWGWYKVAFIIRWSLYTQQVVFRASWTVLWSLYFKTAHGTLKMGSYTAGGLKIKVQFYTSLNSGTKIGSLIIQVVLK